MEQDEKAVRAELFAKLRDAGIDMPRNAKTEDLKARAANIGNPAPDSPAGQENGNSAVEANGDKFAPAADYEHTGAAGSTTSEALGDGVRADGSVQQKAGSNLMGIAPGHKLAEHARSCRVEFVAMVRDPALHPAPHTATVHPAEVENYRVGGWERAV